MKRSVRVGLTLLAALLIAGIPTMSAAAATTSTYVQGTVINSTSGTIRYTSAPATGTTYIYVRYLNPATGTYTYYRARLQTYVPTPATGSGSPTYIIPARPVPQPQPAPQPAPQPGGIQLTAEEKQMFDLVNKERVSAGLSPLVLDAKLVELARMKSRDMAEKGYFDHISPTYGSPFDMMKAAGVSYRAAGENIAGAPTVDSAHSGLMNSPGHRANILNSSYTHIGIGIAPSSKYGMLFTQMFIAK